MQYYVDQIGILWTRLSTSHWDAQSILVLCFLCGLIFFALDLVFWAWDKPKLSYACYWVFFLCYVGACVYQDSVIAAVLFGMGLPIRTITFLTQRKRVNQLA